MLQKDYSLLEEIVKIGRSDNYLFLPKDPFGVYKKIASIVFNEEIYFSDFVDNERNKNLFIRMRENWFYFDTKQNHQAVTNFWFLTFIRQKLPKQFWLYGPLIEENREKIRYAAEDSSKEDMYEVWLDMPDKKRKIKRCPLNQTTLNALYEKRLVVPDYEQIVSEVKKEWGSQYQWGLVEGSTKKMEGALYG